MYSKVIPETEIPIRLYPIRLICIEGSDLMDNIFKIEHHGVRVRTLSFRYERRILSNTLFNHCER